MERAAKRDPESLDVKAIDSIVIYNSKHLPTKTFDSGTSDYLY